MTVERICGNCASMQSAIDTRDYGGYCTATPADVTVRRDSRCVTGEFNAGPPIFGPPVCEGNSVWPMEHWVDGKPRPYVPKS